MANRLHAGRTTKPNPESKGHFHEPRRKEITIAAENRQAQYEKEGRAEFERSKGITRDFTGRLGSKANPVVMQSEDGALKHLTSDADHNRFNPPTHLQKPSGKFMEE